MSEDTLQKEERNRKTGYFISIGLHAALLLLFLIPFVQMIKFPPEESGIMVIFGEPDSGQSDEASATQNQEAEAPEKVKLPEKPVINHSSTRDEMSEVVVVDKKKTKPTTEKPADNQKAKEKLEKERLEKDRLDKEAREKEAAEKKRKISDLFGKGKGDGTKTGDKGNPAGEPNGKVLDGITKGSGRVGGGLASRGLVYEPVFQDNSQRYGKVVLTICVDAAGKVISSKFTQKGSTTSDPYLIQITEKTAAKYKFSPSSIDSQCGTITVEYKVQ